METYVATKLDQFEKGKISRRGLIESLTVAATALYGGAANAQAADPALKVALINHVSFNVPDYNESADWYSRLFNLERSAPGEMDVNLPLGGREGDKPYGVTADDVPLPFLIMRTRAPDAAAGNSGEARLQSRARIDHVAYTIADFDAARVQAELARLGAGNIREDGEHSVHCTDVNGFGVQISGMDMTALTG
jgi:catechol 2,3-dioxygenase-like lactoylglutathione lyase family enzyme